MRSLPWMGILCKVYPTQRLSLFSNLSAMVKWWFMLPVGMRPTRGRLYIQYRIYLITYACEAPASTHAIPIILECSTRHPSTEFYFFLFSSNNSSTTKSKSYDELDRVMEWRWRVLVLDDISLRHRSSNNGKTHHLVLLIEHMEYFIRDILYTTNSDDERQEKKDIRKAGCWSFTSSKWMRSLNFQLETTQNGLGTSKVENSQREIRVLCLMGRESVDNLINRVPPAVIVCPCSCC